MTWKASEMLAEIRAQIIEWEQTVPRSRPEHEAAERFTRAFAELDALLKEGKEPPPPEWAGGIGFMASDYMLVKVSDVADVLPRFEHQLSLTAWEKAATKRLREAVDDAKEQA